MSDPNAIPALTTFIAERRARFPGLSYEVRQIVEQEGHKYVILEEDDGESAGELLLLIRQTGSVELLAIDTVLPDLSSLLPPALAKSFYRDALATTFESREAAWIARARETAPNFDGGSANAITLHWATAAVSNLSSAQAAGTNGGKLACAWAVNSIANLALRKPIGGGLATKEMNKVLALKHAPPQTEPRPGDIIISPTAHATGHVGIVGGEAGEAVHDRTKILSNSSSKKVFYDHFNIGSWRRKYVDEYGLNMYFYRLDPAVFGLTAAHEVKVTNRDTLIRVGDQESLLRAGAMVMLMKDQPDGWSMVAVLPDHRPQGLVQTAHLSPIGTA